VRISAIDAVDVDANDVVVLLQKIELGRVDWRKQRSVNGRYTVLARTAVDDLGARKRPVGARVAGRQAVAAAPTTASGQQ
jgi:hypothetical protein